MACQVAKKAMRSLFTRLKSALFLRAGKQHNRTYPDYALIRIHPCIIQQQACIIYPRGLAESSPALLEHLKQHYQKLGYQLKEDQRSTTPSAAVVLDRRGWVPVIIFSASLLFESSALAEMEINLGSPPQLNSQQVEIRLLSNQAVRREIQQKSGVMLQQQMKQATQTGLADEMFSILYSHYSKNDNDPGYIFADLKKLALYYSRFPEVVTLLRALRNRNWKMKYSEDEWVTIASGSRLQISKTVVHFNTRSAAQLRLNDSCRNNPVCIASPADALLHELLHTYNIVVDTEKFLTQGGMNGMLYPFKHEYAVIDSERKLYASMSRKDGIKRPQRYEHSGHIIKTHCPTCIE